MAITVRMRMGFMGELLEDLSPGSGGVI